MDMIDKINEKLKEISAETSLVFEIQGYGDDTAWYSFSSCRYDGVASPRELMTLETELEKLMIEFVYVDTLYYTVRCDWDNNKLDF